MSSRSVLWNRSLFWVFGTAVLWSTSGCQYGSNTSGKSGPRNSMDRSSSGEQDRPEAASPSDETAAIPDHSSPSESGQGPGATSALKLLTEEHALSDIGSGEMQIKKLCDRNKDRTNSVIRTFCGENKRPKSLVELQQSLGVDQANAQGFAATGHSSSLVGRFVSAINPRVISFASTRGQNGQRATFSTTGFVRGEQLVEVIASNQDSSLDFFIVAFTQACNSRPTGCNHGDLLTPAVESNWTTVTVYQDEDLKNSVFDCRHCHQPSGPSTPKLLLMQELQNPWTHWLSSARNNAAGRALLADYQAAHGTTEIYAGVSNIANSSPQDLEDFIRGNTPNGNALRDTFDSRAISSELSNTPGTSATWNALFERTVRGEIIPVPYYDLKVSDPNLLAKFTKQYTDVREGRMDAATLEDIRKVLKEDQKELAAMGFAVPPSLPADKILTLACAQCHHSKLDQSLSRAKFNVNLSAMQNPKQEILVAIRRLSLGYSFTKRKALGISIKSEGETEITSDVLDHVETMPPPRFKRLTDDQIDRLIAYLKAQADQVPN